MRKLILIFVLIIASVQVKAQFHYSVEVEGGGGKAKLINSIDENVEGCGLLGATGTISYGNKLQFGLSTGVRTYFNALTEINSYGYDARDIYGYGVQYSTISYQYDKIVMIPFIGSATYNFQTKGKISPFLSVNGGWSLAVNTDNSPIGNYYIAGCEAGANYKDFKLSATFTSQGYRYTSNGTFDYLNNVTNEFERKTSSRTGKGQLNTLGIKLAYTFGRNYKQEKD